MEIPTPLNFKMRKLNCTYATIDNLFRCFIINYSNAHSYRILYILDPMSNIAGEYLIWIHIRENT